MKPEEVVENKILRSELMQHPHNGSIAVRRSANTNRATAKINATTRTRRCSNFADALAKKSTVANRTVLERY